jgi:hypothetical protein
MTDVKILRARCPFCGWEMDIDLAERLKAHVRLGPAESFWLEVYRCPHPRCGGGYKVRVPGWLLNRLVPLVRRVTFWQRWRYPFAPKGWDLATGRLVRYQPPVVCEKPVAMFVY